ncbi:MAG: Hsp20 family protein, partial [Desulfobulbus sp.]|nr:Hsp20 family protein [Desulfobulbus sp.]
HITASFKNGVLTVTMPRKAVSGGAEVKKIEITPLP